MVYEENKARNLLEIGDKFVMFAQLVSIFDYLCSKRKKTMRNYRNYRQI